MDVRTFSVKSTYFCKITNIFIFCRITNRTSDLTFGSSLVNSILMANLEISLSILFILLLLLIIVIYLFFLKELNICATGLRSCPPCSVELSNVSEPEVRKTNKLEILWSYPRY